MQVFEGLNVQLIQGLELDFVLQILRYLGYLYIHQ